MCCYLFCWEIPIRSTFLKFCQMQQEESQAHTDFTVTRCTCAFCGSFVIVAVRRRPDQASNQSAGVSATTCAITYLSRTSLGPPGVPPASLITLWYHLCYHLSDNYLVPLWYFSGTSLGPPVVSPASLILLWYLTAFPFSRLCTRVLYCLRCYEDFWKHGKLRGPNLCKLWIQDLWMGRSQESCLPLL